MLVNILIVGCIAGFVCLLLTSFYFRYRVLTAYQVLRRNQVAFDKAHIFDKTRLEAEILPRYPAHREDILRFVGGIRLSMRIASYLIVIITIFAAVLMFIRE